MSSIRILPAGEMGGDFIPKQFLPAGKDQYYLRNSQNPRAAGGEMPWRQLTAREIQLLEKNGNIADGWDKVLVSDAFDPALVKNNRFHGLVRIGRIENAVLEFHDLRLPAGITNSLIISCDIDDNCALHNVRYLSHYIIEDNVVLFNIDEMHTTNYAKFGNGIVKDGEDEKVRIRLDVMNEAGGRSILPFDGILPSDAYLWARYRDDTALQQKLVEITQRAFDSRRGFYGTVGRQSVIKNSRILKDVKIGEFCYIKGANKLKNLTINSSEQEHTQIGEGVELVNGIIGYGCKVFYGCKAVRFVMNDNSALKYGARLIHSFLGANSTISCCEVLNNLIFPAHEQHHNNSFLIASLVMGQSNMAAGATIGSNHNSRANDNEVIAGRGFWPGLCTSIKHSSVFASFVLLAKGAYPSEMNIPFPFSLVNNNAARNRLEIIPAFWWLYNMYALMRNARKFVARDTRVRKAQHVEFNLLAPDTVEEILAARKLLEDALAPKGAAVRTEARTEGDDSPAGDSTVFLDGLEKGGRPVAVLKAREALRAYNDMLLCYGIGNVLRFCEEHPGAAFEEMAGALEGEVPHKWINMGGQLVPEEMIDVLRADINSGKLNDWDAIHRRYDELWSAYPVLRQRHAWNALETAADAAVVTKELFLDLLDRFAAVQDYIAGEVADTRKKDFDNPFRQATFRNKAEMEAVCGTPDSNEFIQDVRREVADVKRRITVLKNRLG
ncbi:MAG: DUF4954 family protein [Spirochaetales bacterium]|nr:DUF4954 family protein [Spirochaetales bacterium]